MNALPKNGEGINQSDVDMNKLASILINDLKVKEAHVHAAIHRAKVLRKSLPVVARDMGLVSSEKIAEAIARSSNFEYFSNQHVDLIDAEQVRKMKELIERIPNFSFNNFIPVGFTEGKLLIAIAEQGQMVEATNTFYTLTNGIKAEICIASEKTIQRVYRMFFANTQAAFELAVKDAKAQIAKDSDDDTATNSIQKLIASLLRHACYVGASDIYLWQTNLAGTIKLKIGGSGQVFSSMELEVFSRMVNYLVMASGKAESVNKGPQDAKVELKSDAIEAAYSDILSRYVFRMSIVQAPSSERERTIVIRLNDSQSAEAEFDALGFTDADCQMIKKYSGSPTGLILVTGPTGSGKTTTLYSILREIDPIERAIFTMEKPIEYRHGSWIQHELGYGDNEGEEARIMLKALLREAPDVILVGELRDDPELIKTCLAASNTGHLVFATLHTNDAPSAIMRLVEMGARREVLATVLKGVLAQRLVPLLCPECKVPDKRESTSLVLKKLGENISHTPCIAKGCVHCDHKGYRGRAMVYELMDASKVRTLIEQNAALSEIKRSTYQDSKSMWIKGLQLVSQGDTSIDQLMSRVDEV